MSRSLAERRPVILSLAYFLLLALFPLAVAVIVAGLGLAGTLTMAMQSGGFLLSILVAFVLMVRSPYSLGAYGVRIGQEVSASEMAWYAPLAMVEAPVLMVGLLVAGFETGPGLLFLAVLAILMLAAAVNEEIYFRGLIVRTLSVKGVRLALLLSSALFGLAHLGSLAVGRGLGHTVMLVAFSALFGLVAAEIAILTRSLLVPIAWHSAHNLLSSLVSEPSRGLTLGIVALQCVVLSWYGCFLWRRITRHNLVA